MFHDGSQDIHLRDCISSSSGKLFWSFFMKKIILIFTFLLFAFTQTFAAESEHSESKRSGFDEAGHEMKEGFKSAGHGIAKGATTTGHYFKKGTLKTGHYIKKGSVKAGHEIKKGSEKVGHEIKEAF